MNARMLVGVAAAVAAALGAGYLLGRGERASVAQGPAATAPATATPSGERKILYYRNPMGLPDTSPTPKKDQMGMDYIPVYEGEEQGGSGVKVSADRIQA
ncbi:MAG TPA: efflux RND transporter periplasmic adaptor subunit, partial [Burkholderiaceae bacterium]|nr:efflux RND transporter periplasmic adaptor subunit [Burkholderiaceae bacterium]